MSSQKQVILKPIVIRDSGEDYDTFVDQDNKKTNAQLTPDENDANDQSNIMGGDRTRHERPQSQNQYSEGPDEDDVPETE